VVDGTLHVKFGRIFQVDVPLKDIKSARVAPKRWWAVGVHQAGGRWIVNGSRQGVVEIEFARSVTPKKTLGGGLPEDPVRSLYLSLREPESFVAALRSHS
jgi:hypothetical protein